MVIVTSWSYLNVCSGHFVFPLRPFHVKCSVDCITRKMFLIGNLHIVKALGEKNSREYTSSFIYLYFFCHGLTESGRCC